jgi:hypothetical protein
LAVPLAGALEFWLWRAIVIISIGVYTTDLRALAEGSRLWVAKYY